MAGKTNIQWTGAFGMVWNWCLGCLRCSLGCLWCYAIQETWRKQFNPMLPNYFIPGLKKDQTPEVQRKIVMKAKGLVAPEQFREDNEMKWRLDWTGNSKIVLEALQEPIQNKKPTIYFVNSMSDIFLDSFEFKEIDHAFDIMERANWHVYLCLTKRADRLEAYAKSRYSNGNWPSWVWMGVTVDNQTSMKRAETLVRAKAQAGIGTTFLSIEPQLELITGIPKGIDWCLTGGESGSHARPYDPTWAISLIKECRSKGIAPFVKQMGEPWAKTYRLKHGKSHKHGGNPDEWPAHLRVREFPVTPWTDVQGNIKNPFNI